MICPHIGGLASEMQAAGLVACHGIESGTCMIYILNYIQRAACMFRSKMIICTRHRLRQKCQRTGHVIMFEQDFLYIHAPVSFGQANKIDHLNILNTIQDDLLKNSVPESVEGISHGPWTFCAYWFEHVNPASRSWTVSPPQRVPGEHTLSIGVILVGQFYVDGQF